MQDYPVLYVDDEAPNLDVFEAVFGDAFVVHLANSGEEALALLDTERIAIVVADNRMPHMSGIELFRIIGERFPVVRRVLCTAYSDQRTAIDAINTIDSIDSNVTTNFSNHGNSSNQSLEVESFARQL